MNLKELKLITPLVIDDGMIRMTDQAAILLQDIGTEREWCSIGLNDHEGLAEIVMLAHPTNAALIVHCVNNFAQLVAHIASIANIEADENSEPDEMAAALRKINTIASIALDKAQTIPSAEKEAE